MKSNNKIITGKNFDNLLRLSWALLLFAIRTLTDFLDIKQIIELKSWIFFCFIHFLAENKKKLTIVQFQLKNLKQA